MDELRAKALQSTQGSRRTKDTLKAKNDGKVGDPTLK